MFGDVLVPVVVVVCLSSLIILIDDEKENLIGSLSGPKGREGEKLICISIPQ